MAAEFDYVDSEEFGADRINVGEILKIRGAEKNSGASRRKEACYDLVPAVSG